MAFSPRAVREIDYTWGDDCPACDNAHSGPECGQFTAVRVISAEVGQLAGACVCAASSRVPACLPERRLKAVEASGHTKILKTRLGIPPAAGSQRTGLLSSPPTNVNGQITPNVNGTFSSSRQARVPSLLVL